MTRSGRQPTGHDGLPAGHGHGPTSSSRLAATAGWGNGKPEVSDTRKLAMFPRLALGSSIRSERGALDQIWFHRSFLILGCRFV